MAASYSDRSTGGQPATRKAGEATRRLADRLLIATCEAADNAQVARVERRLREAALRFVLHADARGARRSALDCLGELLDETGADAAFVVIDDPARVRRPLLACGNGYGAALVAAPDAALLHATQAARRRGQAIEHPGDLNADCAAAIQDAGVRFLRWSERDLGDGRRLLVALHAAGGSMRLWTPLRRRFHDGVCELLAAALPRLTARRR
jgi:hypothetical protein